MKTKRPFFDWREALSLFWALLLPFIAYHVLMHIAQRLQ